VYQLIPPLYGHLFLSTHTIDTFSVVHPYCGHLYTFVNPTTLWTPFPVHPHCRHLFHCPPPLQPSINLTTLWTPFLVSTCIMGILMGVVTWYRLYDVPGTREGWASGWSCAVISLTRTGISSLVKGVLKLHHSYYHSWPHCYCHPSLGYYRNQTCCPLSLRRVQLHHCLSQHQYCLRFAPNVTLHVSS